MIRPLPGSPAGGAAHVSPAAAVIAAGVGRLGAVGGARAVRVRAVDLAVAVVVDAVAALRRVGVLAVVGAVGAAGIGVVDLAVGVVVGAVGALRDDTRRRGHG